MKKSLILLGMLSIGYAYSQEGNVGINTENPKATLEVLPNSANLTKTTNEGIIAPKLTKARIAGIADANLVEGTLVYATDNTYTGANTKVSKITEKGYYYYNGTEWVKVQYKNEGSKWTNNTVDNVVKLTNLSDGVTARDDNKNIFIGDDGNIGIGINKPTVNLHIKGKNESNAEILLTRYTNTNNGANLTLLKAKGSSEAPSVPTGNLANIKVGGYTGGGSNPQTSSGYDEFASQIITSVAGDTNINGTLPTNMALIVTNKEGVRNTLLKLQGDSGVGVGYGVNEDIKARLHINEWNDVTLTSTKNALLIGRETASNLVMDSNEIMARNNGKEAPLTLQAQGGDLFVNAEDTDVTKRFYFRSSTGNVGLGITTPSEKLEVVGKIKTSSLAGSGDRIVYADENGILKTGDITSPNIKLATTTNIECSQANTGTMNFGSVIIDGKSTEAFGFCMKNSTGEYKWYYIYGGAGITTGTGVFGNSL